VKITHLEVDGFGAWKGLELDDLSDGLNVFYGANEAGKTTLMQFVRTMLYGFSATRRARYLPPCHGGRAGGMLRVAGPDGLVDIVRHDQPDAADQVTGELSLRGSNGPLNEVQALTKLLRDVDEATFNHVFAVGLREIQELGTLGDNDAAQWLYSLTTGLDRVSLVDVLRELTASRERILSTDGRPSQVVQLLNEREKLLGEIDELRAIVPQYAQLAAQREQLQSDIERREKEVRELQQTVGVAELAQSLRDKWRQRNDLDQQLTAIGQLPRLPAGALVQLEDINDRVTRHEHRLEEVHSERELLQEEIASLGINDALCRQAARIEALTDQQSWLESLSARIDQLTAEVKTLESQLAGEQKDLGLSSDATSRVQLHGKSVKELRTAAKGVRAARQKLKEISEQNDQKRQVADSASKEIRSALSGRSERDLKAALERSGTLVTNLRRRIQLDERLDQLARNEKEVKEDTHDALDHQLLPPWVLMSIGGVFVCGVVLILAGLLLPGWHLNLAGWALAGLGLVGAAIAGAAKSLWEAAAKRHLEACRKQLKTIEQQTAKAKEEREKIDAQLPKGSGPMLARLQAEEKNLASLEDLLSLDGKRQSAEQQVGTVEGGLQAAKDECAAAEKRWLQALAKGGLPANMKPQQVRALAMSRQRIGPLNQQLERVRQELADRRRDLQSASQRISQIATDANLVPVSDRPLERLKQIRQELTSQQGLLTRRDGWREKDRRFRRHQTKVSQALRRAQRQRRDLLTQSGVMDESEFRRLAERQAQAETIRRERDTLARDIAAALAGRCSEETLRQRIEQVLPDQPTVELPKQSQRLQTSQQTLQGMFEQRGQLNEQLKSLAGDRRLAERTLDLGVVEERLREALERWQVLAVTQLLLERIRGVYERERQPETLQEASRYLAQMTSGRYTRVWTPLGEHLLRVDDSQGNSLPVEVLSRGTREQLFLCLRLALVASYARRGVRLPLVLDDVFVNFDAGRARAAAGVLRDFAAEGHQLLVFTCHEHTVKFFKLLKATVRELPLRGDAAQLPKKLELEEAPEEPEVIAPVVVAKRPEKKPEKVERKVEKKEKVELPPPVEIVVAEPLPEPPAPKAPEPVAEADWEHELDKPAEPASEPEEEAFPHRRSLATSRIRRHSGPFDDAIWQEPINDELEVAEDAFHDFDADDDIEDEIESWDKSSVEDFDADDDDAEAA
jgi:uncharacterized protein YhaN